MIVVLQSRRGRVRFRGLKRGGGGLDLVFFFIFIVYVCCAGQVRLGIFFQPETQQTNKKFQIFGPDSVHTYGHVTGRVFYWWGGRVGLVNSPNYRG